MRILAVSEAFPAHYHDQETISARLRALWQDDPNVARRLETLHENVCVEARNLTLPIADYGTLVGFGATNDAWIEHATDLGATALVSALAQAGMVPHDVDAIFFSTVTGIASPSIDARLVNRVGLRADVKRTPMFGLGCVAGAAAVSRAADYLRGHPDHVAAVLTVELCSLTLQLGDRSVANLISTGLFGDGASAAIVAGANRGGAGPEIVATRSTFYEDTEDVMGWHVTETGFRIVLSPQVPVIARERMPEDVDAFLAAQGLRREDIGVWVCHPGGPKVLEALGEGLGLERADLAHSWRTLARRGNLSSVSVLLVLRATMVDTPPRAGTRGLMLAMGPGFCSELVLLRW